MNCPSCQRENPPDAGFCSSCGQRLSVICASCGRSNPPDASFCNGCGTQLTKSTAAAPARDRDPRSYTPKHLTEKILRSKSALEGERKQVTVLFADVKGSMELAEQVDPEEWHQIMDRFFKVLNDGVHRYEGTVNQYTGDGIMALFGAPIAHEDHARRACYAALTLREQLRQYADELRLERGLNFSVRLGLNSGEVVVGKIGDDLRMDYTAQGHTVGLAQRVEQLAEPGRAYLTQHTARLVEGFFQLRGLGEAKVSGSSEPLHVYELQDVGPLRSRLEVSASRGLVRFVGRQAEMEQLRYAWEATQEGRGQIVAVLGEAGVGKSRLVYEFKTPLESGCRVLEAFSVSHGKAYAYLPLVELLKSYFRINVGDDERRRREKITGTVLTLDRTLEDTLPYLFSLLGIGDETPLLEQMNPEIRGQRTREAVKRVLVRETLDQPCAVIFEDLHWIDTETQAFLDVLSESVATARLLLLVNYRPEYEHTWGSKTYYTQLRLDPFGEKEAQELLNALLGEEATEERQALERLIMDKTQGNPFFMEELVRTLAEEGVLVGEEGHYRLERPPSELHIPPTVQAVLAARIDRLPPQEKELLQTLAVIGKEFSLGLIRAVVEQGEDDLFRGLSNLRAAEYVYEQPAFPDPEYVFKHALTQEVAYESLLGERRGVLHERTGRAIEELYADTLDAHYEELAHHYGRTESTAKAVEYLYLAGTQATHRSAYTEASGQLDRAVNLLATLPDTRERKRQELPLQLGLGQVLRISRMYEPREAESAFVRARDLAEQLGDAQRLLSAIKGLRWVQVLRGQLDQAGELAKQQLQLARETEDPAALLLAHVNVGDMYFWRGEFRQSLEHLEEVIRLYDPQQQQFHEYSVRREDPQLSALARMTWALQALGYPDQALERGREALVRARELSAPAAEVLALNFAGRVHGLRGEWQATVEVAEAVIALSREHGDPAWAGAAVFERAWASSELGQIEEGIAGMQAVAEAWQAAGFVLNRPAMLAALADAHRQAGQLEEGLAVVAQALGFVEETGEREAEVWVLCAKGELLLARSPSDQPEAEACFRAALEVAHRQSAKSWELRAATRLARLWQQQRRKDEARELLAPVYEWFTEGFDTRDLRDAKTLLGELA